MSITPHTRAELASDMRQQAGDRACEDAQYLRVGAGAIDASITEDIQADTEYMALLKCRQAELAYVRSVLEAINRREGEPPRAQCADLLLWLNSRATCHPFGPSAEVPQK